MCFAPYISLATFVIEFSLALFFLLRDPRDNLNRMLALISFLLGFYQLNEFLICTTGFNLFSRLAVITTSLLPVLAVFFALIVFRKKLRFYWRILICAPAVFFVLMFAISDILRESATCMTIFIQYPYFGLVWSFLGLYYIVYLVAALILFYFASLSVKTKEERRLSHLGMLAMLIFTVPTFVFLLFLPVFNVQFPSVLCEFGLLLAIELIVLIWYKEKHNLKY